MVSRDLVVATPHGEGRLVTDRALSPVATLLLGHGAGGGVDAPDLLALARRLPRHGITVVRFEQPWHRAGRRVAGSPASLDASLLAAYDRLRIRTPLVVGGRSAGARSATRLARRMGAAGCLALAFPLHPPGRPEKSRIEELRGSRLPTLVVQGERDELGRPEEFPDDLVRTELVVVPDADHGFAVHKRGPISAEEAMRIVVESTLAFVRTVAGTPPRV